MECGSVEGGREPVSGESKPLRFGILGCGVVAGAHASAIAGLPDAELVAVADPVVERASALAERYGVAGYNGLAGMLSGAELDVVNICTASGLHGEHAREAMRAGMHVMVEKPLEITLDEIDQTLEVQREAGVQLAVISQHRFDPAAGRIKE